MITKFSLTILAGLALGLFLFAVGCSVEERENSGSAVSETQAMRNEFVDGLVETTFAAIKAEAVEADFASLSEPDLPPSEGIMTIGMIVKDAKVYALIPGGVLISDLEAGQNRVILSDEPLNAIIDLGEKILVGGNNLYTVNGDLIEEKDFELNLPGEITVMESYGRALLIGTDEGFYEASINGVRELAASVCVTALAVDNNGVWVGTAGEGLFYLSDNKFHKRYLRRDSTLFDNVTALEFNHDHLYLGTDRGFYIYDGGSWQPYDLADGLPSEVITSINADEWVIRIGTARGPVTFFDNTFRPIPKLEGYIVNRMVNVDGKLLAATENSGLVMLSGGLLTTLYNGPLPPSEIALEESF